MKKTIYVETSVVSYYTGRPSRDVRVAGHQEATRDLWPRLCAEFETYISAIVYEEAARGDADQAEKRLQAIRPFKMLDVDERARTLAERILSARAVPEQYPEDALHIAIAAVNGIHVLLTWNFAHLNNPFTRMTVREEVESAGYLCPEICSPDELLESDR